MYILSMLSRAEEEDDSGPQMGVVEIIIVISSSSCCQRVTINILLIVRDRTGIRE